VGFPRKVGLPRGVEGTSQWEEAGISPREQKEPHGWEKVGSLGTLGRESPSRS